MAYAPHLEVVDVGQAEEAAPGTFGAAVPQLGLSTENFADDESVQRYIDDVLIPIIRETKEGRKPLHDEWNAIRRMELLEHDDGRRYIGRSTAYLPLYNKAMTTRVSTIASGLFPTDEYMEVGTRKTDLVSKAKAQANKLLLQWEFERVAHVQSVIKTGLRSLENFGLMVFKAWYDKRLVRQTRRSYGGIPPNLLALPGGAGAYGGMDSGGGASYGQRMMCEGLVLSARSPFNVYFYPVTASDISACEWVFETLRVPVRHVEMMGKDKRYKNVEEALQHRTDEDLDLAEDQQLQDSALMGEQRVRRQTHCVLTEAWGYMELPKRAYSAEEYVGEPVPVRVLLAGSTPVVVERNQLWHQGPPYLVTGTNRQPGFFYGYGVGRVIRDLQYLANDFANQTNDCGNYILNPINKIDPGAVAGPLSPLHPGVTWYFTDVAKGQMFDRPPTDLIMAGQSMLNMYISMLADYSGAPPVLQGSGAGRGGKTATGMQILQRNAQNPLQDVVEDIELEILQPLMRMTWMLEQQFREEEVMIQVAGQSIRFDPRFLDFDPEFRWLASSQAANQQQRAAQQLQLIQVLAPLVPLLAQQGKVVDFQYLVSRLATDGLGFRGMEEVIKDDPMAAMQLMGAAGGGPPRQGGGPPSPGGEARSAVPGQSAEEPVTPGEGDDFGGVRQNADELSAMLGAMNGGTG